VPAVQVERDDKTNRIIAGILTVPRLNSNRQAGTITVSAVQEGLQ
jgi:hypothetical protein